jgi:hypothetical protein
MMARHRLAGPMTGPAALSAPIFFKIFFTA